ncbi:Mrp/NBP35 family ATP-binding protein [Actinobaculum suis]|uniref:Mrp/NBP35 family ATP-binding protein n=1 Tax=Actinobaculum suis TaxID=1657 RepID=UPI003F65B724
MRMVTKQAIVDALSKVIDPELRHPITELNMVDSIAIDESGNVAISILLTTSDCPLRNTIERDVRQAAQCVAGVQDVQVAMGSMTPRQIQDLTRKLRGKQVRGEITFAAPDSPTRIYAIASGKGGVGKSSVCANLAAALAANGLRVGLVDADIYGFSIPRMLGVETPAQQLNGMIVPPVAHGVKVMSIGMFVRDNSPIMWRGPMLSKALEQFFADVYWGELDVMLLDLPPGTGDVAISVGSLLPTSQLVVVTTPQSAAADVAERAGTITKQTGQPVAGVIENMSWMVLPDGQREYLFGQGGGETVARALSGKLGYEVPLLGQVPFETAIREGADAGTPAVLSLVETAAGKELREIATQLSQRPRPHQN